MISPLLAWVWALLALGAPQALPAQPLKPPAGLIVGQVVDATTGKPIVGAMVTISSLAPAPVAPPASASVSAPPAARRVIVDDQGRYLFRDLSKGLYSLKAEAPGYLDGGYGQTRIAGDMRPFSLAADQKVGDVGIRLWNDASISGTITDDRGDPVSGVSVSLIRRGKDGLSRAATASTNDRGAYRFAGLIPGDYLVSVVARMTTMPVDLPATQPTLQGITDSGSELIATLATTGGLRFGDSLLQATNPSAGINHLVSRLPISAAADGRISAYRTTFYPGATTPQQASAIALAAGADRSEVNLRLAPVLMTRVSGTLTGPDGPLAHFAVHLIPAYAINTPLERTDEVIDTVTDASGAFTFIGAPPGPYVVKAWRLVHLRSTDPDIVPDTSLWGQAPVVAGADPVSGVAVTLRPGGVISGRMVFNGSQPKPAALAAGSIIPRWFEPAWPGTVLQGLGFRGQLDAAGQFQSLGLPPGSYTAKISGPVPFRGWSLESIILDGKDLLTTPVAINGQNVTGVVITFTDKVTQISGQIQDSTGKADPTASVLLFPADYRAWIQSGMIAAGAYVISASQSGAYASTDVRPGEYLAVAIGETTVANWQQPATIDALAPMATRVTLAAGDSKQQDLKTVRR